MQGTCKRLKVNTFLTPCELRVFYRHQGHNTSECTVGAALLKNVVKNIFDHVTGSSKIKTKSDSLQSRSFGNSVDFSQISFTSLENFMHILQWINLAFVAVLFFVHFDRRQNRGEVCRVV